ncbi:MAG: PEP-CTERM sorting domain-containing protein, partial [Microcystis panniformis]
IYVADTSNNRVQVFRTPEPSSIIGLGILGGGLVARHSQRIIWFKDGEVVYPNLAPTDLHEVIG